MKQERRILYILGAGRSGSTLLDIALGNSPQIFGAGELVYLHERGWLNDEHCACGERVNQCAFWREVKSRWTRRSPADAVGRFLELQRRFERMRYLFLGAGLLRDAEFREYLQSLRSLLLCVFEASGRPCLVDSSKKPMRAFHLSLVDDVDVYLLHLVRDSRGVAFSKAKAFARDERGGVQADVRAAPVARTARRWLLTNLVCSSLLSRRRPGRYLRLRYEDFVADPGATLRRIAALCEVDLAETIRKVTEGEALEVGHTVGGNRVRMTRRLAIRPDLEWRAKLSAAQESSIWRWTGRLLRHYGYARGLEGLAQGSPVLHPLMRER